MEINTVRVTLRSVPLKKQDIYMTVSCSPKPVLIHNIAGINIIVDVYNIHLFNMGFGIRETWLLITILFLAN